MGPKGYEDLQGVLSDAGFAFNKGMVKSDLVISPRLEEGEDARFIDITLETDKGSPRRVLDALKDLISMDIEGRTARVGHSVKEPLLYPWRVDRDLDRRHVISFVDLHYPHSK